MRPLRTVLWAGAVVVFAAAAGRADAAWNNVFQVCCQHCGSAPPTTSNFTAAAADPCCPQPCPQPCPQQVCETRYVQRTYYQPETHFETRTAYEPVTTYRTSFFWEPVTNYRVSCFFDPCTCSYKQVSTPVTSFRLRQQCCPVQSWVARCFSVPVTTMKAFTRCEPVTSCYWTTAAAAAPACPPPCPAPAPAQAPSAGVQVNPLPPAGAGVNDGRPPANVGQPGVNDTGSDGARQSDKRYDPYAAPQGYRQYAPPAGAAPKAASPTTPVRPEKFVQAPPAVRLEKIVPVPPANVEGQVVRADSTPDAGARLTFKRADREGETHTVTADGTGRFKATLASGGWDVYTHRADGQLLRQTRIDVSEDRTSRVELTSR
jgi:hypothetical protein